MIPPREPTGTSTFVSWCKKLLRYATSLEIKPGPGYRVTRTPGGTILDIQGGGGGGTTVKRYHVKEHKADYLVCRTWDGTTEGTEDVNIAKPPELRFSVTKETVDGVQITYSTFSTTAQTRLGDDGTNTETQVIVPRYRTEASGVVDKVTEIHVVTVAGGTGVKDDLQNDITLEDVNVAGRAWAKQTA